MEVKNTALDWARNPLVATCTQTTPVSLQERLMDTPLTKCRFNLEKEYPDVEKHVLYQLLSFGFTYLCEVTFSDMVHIKTKERNRLSLETHCS